MFKKIQKQCRIYNIKEHELQGNFNISLQNKWIYIEDAKVGCSTIKYNLIQIELETSGLRLMKYKNISPNFLHEPMFGPMLHPFQIPKNILEDIFHSNEWFRFSFVRNPYDRILSAYLDKIAKHKAPKIHIVRKLKNSDDLTHEVSFKEFLQLLKKEKRILQIDKHWRPQYENLILPTMTYDFIGRLENFNEDFQFIKSKITGINQEDHVVEDYTPHKTSANTKLAEYYCDECIQIVQEIYATDFEEFGYDKRFDC